MPTLLTDRVILLLQPPAEGRVEIADTKKPGLGLRLSSSGRRTWFYVKRIRGGTKRRHTIGTYPAISLAQAREAASELEVEAMRGIDSVEEDRKKRAEKSAAVSVGDVLAVYDVQHLQANLRTARERKLQLDAALKGVVNLPFKDVTRAQLQAVIDRKAQSAPIAANRVKAALCAFTRWATQRGYTDSDAGVGLRRVTKEVSRELVLTLDQVRQIIVASHYMGETWGPVIRLLVYTAQRRGDIAGLTFNEVCLSESRLEISGGRTKNGKPHIVHLSAPGLTELVHVKERRLVAESAAAGKGDAECDLLFTTNRRREVSGFGRMKERLDRNLGVRKGDFPQWRLHDLRTAFATAMAEAGEPEGVVDRVLNHVASGSSASTVARTYNRAGMLTQRAAALDRWARVLEEDTQANIIPIRATIGTAE